jgi:glutathione S-transferase
MSETIVFYTNPQSRGRIARWMLEEAGAPYRTEYVTFGEAMKSPAYRAVNPMGKVPTIVHGGRTITECAAICAYLADAFPERGLAPPPADRADYYRWLFFCAGPLESAVSNRAFGFEVPHERERSIGYGNFADVMDTLEHAVSRRPYVAGDHFSAADVYVGSQVGWGLFADTIERRPTFQAYLGRLTERPAYQRAAQIDNDAAKAMPEN